MPSHANAGRGLMVAVLFSLAACDKADPPPQRGVESLLLADRSGQDTITPAVTTRHDALLAAMMRRDRTVGDYVTPAFKFQVVPAVGSLNSVAVSL